MANKPKNKAQKKQERLAREAGEIGRHKPGTKTHFGQSGTKAINNERRRK